jgi:hypothetical protein
VSQKNYKGRKTENRSIFSAFWNSDTQFSIQQVTNKADKVPLTFSGLSKYPHICGQTQMYPETFTLLACYAAQISSLSMMFQDNLLVPLQGSSSQLLKRGPIGCPKRVKISFTPCWKPEIMHKGDACMHTHKPIHLSCPRQQQA